MVAAHILVMQLTTDLTSALGVLLYLGETITQMAELLDLLLNLFGIHRATSRVSINHSPGYVYVPQ